MRSHSMQHIYQPGLPEQISKAVLEKIEKVTREDFKSKDDAVAAIYEITKHAVFAATSVPQNTAMLLPDYVNPQVELEEKLETNDPD